MTMLNTATHAISEPQESPLRSALSVLAIPPGIRSRYKRIALISDRRQIRDLGSDDDTLVVTSDWLAWREIAEARGHGVHYEAFLETWPAARGEPDAHEAESARWVEHEGLDVTLFEGVSLGRQFTTHVSRFRHAYLRLWHALDRACERFSPDEIVFHGLRVEYDILDADMVRALVADVAGKHGTRFVDRATPATRISVTFPVGPFARKPGKPRVAKGLLLALYAGGVDAVFRLRAAFASKRPRVYIMLNWLAVDNLLQNFDGNAITPVLLVEPWPKRLGFLLRCWRKGVLLARLPEGDLDERERASIAAIESGLRAKLADGRSGIARALALFVTRHVLESGWLRERAREAKRYRRLLADRRVERLLVGDAENMTCRLLIEVGHRLGIPADELPNGVFTTTHRSDIRSGPGKDRPSVARLLLWGRHLEAWAEASAPGVPRATTGYPSLDRLREDAGRARTEASSKSALVLPLTVQRHNFRGLYAETFASLVETVRMLRALGYATVRVKLHPGMTATEGYYRDILRHYGLACEVLTTGSVGDLARTADIVVGPVNTNAFLETLAAGKPYYAVRGTLASFRPELVGGIKVYTSIPDLRRALEQGETPAREAILQWFCSTSDIPNASREVWRAVEAAV
ncbi:MAG: hypothetical protein EXQ86_08530, partial [Rhodospirillales bacterium]|nr:hypothetical protein [Rhodospirillales bacterium]